MAAAVRGLGPDIFVALSGFLLCRSLASPDQPATSAVLRRLARIVPLYAIVLAAYVASSLLIRPEPSMPAPGLALVPWVLRDLLLVPLAFGAPPIMSGAWTLGALVVLYVGFCAGARLVRATEWSAGWRAVAYAAASLVVSCASQTLIANCTALFLAGAAIRELTDVIAASRAAAWAFLALALAGLIFRLDGTLPPAARAVMRVAAVGPALFCVVSQHMPMLRAWFDRRALAGFGRMSYSYYLIHSGVLVMLRCTLFVPAASFLPAEFAIPALLAVSLSLTLACSAVVYVALELPLRRRTNGWFAAGPARSQKPRYSGLPVCPYASQPVTASGIRPRDGQHAKSARAGA